MSFGTNSGSSSEDNNSDMSDINMTPLIDVMLVLLIIFIITLPVITHSVKVDLPQVSSQVSSDKPNIITLSIDKDGKVFWDNAFIENAELLLRLTNSSAQNPQPEVHIRGDKQVEYQYMIKVMAAAQHAGLTKLGFITDHD